MAEWQEKENSKPGHQSIPFRQARQRLRACFKIAWGPAARDFGCGQGGEAGAAPQRAVTAEPTRAAGKKPAARRVFAQKAAWLRCSSVEDPPGIFSFVAPRHSAFCAKTGPHGILKQALNRLSGSLPGQFGQRSFDLLHQLQAGFGLSPARDHVFGFCEHIEDGFDDLLFGILF